MIFMSTLVHIIEDDPSISEIEAIALKNSNYDVMIFGCATEFFEQIEKVVPNLLILDLMLPDENGYEIVRKLRSNPKTRELPVIIVSAKTTELDLLKGLDGGADDYVKKPFSVLELLSRVKALLRRTRSCETHKDFLAVGGVSMDDERRIVAANGKKVDLTFKEYELLKYLLTNREVVLSREKILRVVWNTNAELETRTVDMHIKTLRKKLGGCGKQIRTIRNVGYSISADGRGVSDKNESQ